MGPGSSIAPISLDDLIALNDEIIALVRAGVPLEQGLHDLSRDLPGELGRISDDLASRMRRGESLERVLQDPRGSLPPVYHAVVEAGLRSGRLAAGLENLGTSVRRLADLRRVISLAMIYPLFVFLLTYALFVFLVVKLAPVMVAADWTHNHPTVLRWLQSLASTAHFWGPIIPTLVIAFAIYRWRRLRSSAALVSRAPSAFSWIPSLRSVMHNSRLAVFSDMLGMLIEQGVPLPQSLSIAGRSSGDVALARSGDKLAADAASAHRPSENSSIESGVPPLLNWMLANSHNHTQLSLACRFAAANYQRRAKRQAEWLTVYLPLLLTAVIGGTVTLLYALSFFWPWSMMMRSFALP